MNRHSLAAVSAGILWGSIGLYSRYLTALGFDSWSLVTVRCGLGAICFALWALLRDPGLLRIRLRDLWCFVGTGVFSLLLFSYCYFCALEVTEMSTASILLYTAPVFVMILSRVIFGERVGRRGVAAVILCFAGVVLVSGLGGRVSLPGLVYGLISGIGYALFSIFSRFALNRGYSTLTINFYACSMAAAGAACINGLALPAQLMWTNVPSVLCCVALGTLACFAPYGLYTYSLTGIANGTASVMASVEPVTATLLSVFLFHEGLSPMALCGILLVLAAIVLMNLPKRACRGPKE